MENPPPSTPRRVGLRAVAEAAGVCLMTVSLALRDSPKISAATRKRVRTIAARIGYRPDPEISRLMGRLRSSRLIRGSVVIATVNLRGKAGLHPYGASVDRGVVRRAGELGFAVSRFNLADFDGDPKALLRVIRTRGITGVILLPSGDTMGFDPAIDWSGLSVVSATTSVIAPRFHSVVPNQLHNMMSLIARARERGCRRIAAVLRKELEERTRNHYSLALSWHGHRSRIIVLPDGAEPAENHARVRAWFARHRPDAVFAQDADFASRVIEEVFPADQRPWLVSLAGRADSRIAFEDQLPERIGESAVSLIAGMLDTHETGVPPHPRVTTIDGVLREPPASPRRSDR